METFYSHLKIQKTQILSNKKILLFLDAHNPKQNYFFVRYFIVVLNKSNSFCRRASLAKNLIPICKYSKDFLIFPNYMIKAWH